MGGAPMSAMAVDNLRFVPPLKVPLHEFAYGPNPSFNKAHSTVYS